MLVVGLNYFPEVTSTGRYTTAIGLCLTERGPVAVVTAPPYYPAWRVAAGYSAWQYRTEDVQGIRVHRCPLWVPHEPTGFKRLLHLLSFGVSSLPVLLLQAFTRPDVIVCVVPTMFSAPGALLAARFSGARCWLHIQDFELDAALGLGMLPGGRLLSGVARAFERFVLTHFDRVSTISENMLKLAIAKGVKPERAVLFPNWVDTHQIHPLEGASPLRCELGIPEGTRVVLYHGNMGRKQGLETVLDAAQALSSRAGILFLLCGEGAARADLERRARGLQNVRFLGLQPEARLNDLVNLADVHVLPQKAGAADLVMPSKLTTMLASGKPVIISAAPGTHLSKVAGEVGVAVNPECGPELADAILRLLADPAQMRRLGSLGRQYACEHLEKEVVLGRFWQDLSALVDERGEPSPERIIAPAHETMIHVQTESER